MKFSENHEYYVFTSYYPIREVKCFYYLLIILPSGFFRCLLQKLSRLLSSLYD
jgi:hypothetical protein